MIIKSLKRNGTIFLSIGLFLIFISVYPIVLITKETIVENQIASRYEIKEITNIWDGLSNPHKLNSPINILGNTIEVNVKNTGLTAPIVDYNNEPGYFVKITVKVNGVIIAAPIDAQFLVGRTGDTRFLSWLNIVKVTDHKTGNQMAAVVERISGERKEGEGFNEYLNKQTWRVIYVGENKKVKVEQFSYPKRGEHLLSTRLVIISQEASTLMGLQNDSLSFLPSYVYPLLYPIIITFLGIVLTIIGVILFTIRSVKQRNRTNVNDR